MVDRSSEIDPRETTAYWDFANRIITPTVERLINDPANAHAVEIGFGDGALLCPASQFFGRVTGVSLDSVDDESNARQLTTSCAGAEIDFATLSEDRQLAVPDGSVDFFYSLNGIRRLSSLQDFERTAAEIARALKPSGVAMLWFGRMSRMPFAPLNSNWFRGWTLRSVPQRSDLPEIRHLHMRMFHARRAVMRSGMKAVALSTPAHPDTSWRLFRGGQMSYVTALKPA